MGESPAHAVMRQRLIEAALSDPRIVGLVSDGSTSAGRGDQWSDLDVSLFIRYADYDGFGREWVGWAQQFGDRLLAFTSHVGHPWTVYDAAPVPLRVDFDFHPESAVDTVDTWPTSPISTEAMLWYDGTGGRLEARVERLVGKSLRPTDPRATFEQHCGDLWYELLYTFSKLQRGELWVARQAFHCRAMEPLLRLVRLEAGAVERWQASPAAADIERTISHQRLERLTDCVPAAGAAGVRRALLAAAMLGQEVCEAIAARHGWPWPAALARQTVQAFRVTRDDSERHVRASGV